jgi:hypothetical protein
MWVWIPRYIYKISTGWHSNTTGTIDIQFSKGIDDNWNSSAIGIIDTGISSNTSNNKWTNQPAFTFGNTKLTGIWVAKFEATAAEGVANGYNADGSCLLVEDNVTTKTIKSVPNATSWRCISVGNTFTNIRNMETNANYGWNIASGLQENGIFTTDTNNLDTHLMKNTEWGAVTYLSESIYGQGTNEIWINNSQTYTTGCAGTAVSSGAYSGCQNTYETANGGKASTTSNIYGVYDMSGGSWEYVAANVDNANVNLGQGSNIIGAAAQYKNVYTKGSTDDQANNYALTVNKKGDALWETSNNINGSYSWFSDYSYMPNTSNPWFLRGGACYSGFGAGAFSFSYTIGGTNSNNGFRPTLIVGEGL